MAPPLAPDRLVALNSGTTETRTLAECLAVDQAVLAQAVLGADTAAAIARTAGDARALGISRQMAAVGAALAAAVPAGELAELARHPSDTVRGWVAFAVGRGGNGDGDGALAQRLAAQRPFAADSHFGVREWAWLAVRPFIARAMATDGPGTVALLVPWTADPDANVRRFAVESTRPRGVWCEHIPTLKQTPEPAAALLEPLRADPARYVQDSVANWLNDAGKTRPDWVVALCGRWAAAGHPDTARIVARALRSIRKG